MFRYNREMLYKIPDTVVLDYYKAEDNRYADMIICDMISHTMSEKLFDNICKAENLDSCEKSHLEILSKYGLSAGVGNMISCYSQVQFFKANRNDIMKYLLSLFEFNSFVKCINEKHNTELDSNDILEILFLDYNEEENEYADMIICDIVSEIVSDVCTKLLESD